jgi:hypothetical protein
VGKGEGKGVLPAARWRKKPIALYIPTAFLHFDQVTMKVLFNVCMVLKEEIRRKEGK